MIAPSPEKGQVYQFRAFVAFLTSCRLMSDDVGMDQGRKEKAAKPNQFFCGDNLEVLRRHLIPDASVDLIYLDPPFQSGRNYNLLFSEQDGTRSPSQQEAFEDTWEWDYRARATYDELVAMDTPVSRVMESMRLVVHDSPMLAYMSMMAVRLIELHRVLKATGSLYLHCDTTASHYLKLVLDTIFGPDRFMSEITWKRTTAHSDAKQGRLAYGDVSDILLYYTKSPNYTFNLQHVGYDAKYLKKYHYQDQAGRRYRLDNLTGPGGAANGNPSYKVMGVTRYWRYKKERMAELITEGRIVQTKPGSVPQYKRYLDEMPGVPLQNLWIDIPAINSQARERMGYPTQKPLALLERIIMTSSNAGDIVIDPFCGCGTSIEAAHKLRRRWIGIDVTHLAEDLIRKRLDDDIALGSYSSRYFPRDLESARRLATKDRAGRFEFQRWALEFFGVYSEEDEDIQGADGGIDGVLEFQEGGQRSPWKKIIFSVKSGKTSVKDVQDLAGVVSSDKNAAMGVLITLEEPTDPMHKFAVGAGDYVTAYQATQEKFPKIQIFTVAELLDGATLRAPRAALRKNPRPFDESASMHFTTAVPIL